MKRFLDFTWLYTSANGRITHDILSAGMKLRVVASRPETCASMYNGPIVLPDGAVLCCNCVAAMGAIQDLKIGEILQSTLSEIWSGARMRELRSSFGTSQLNSTCADCDMYRDLEFYRTKDGRQRAKLNLARAEGKVVQTQGRANRPFSGG